MNEAFPLLHVANVDEVADWAITSLGLEENWRAPGQSNVTEHAELLWYGDKISINIQQQGREQAGTSGISLRVESREQVDKIYARAKQTGANISQELAESMVAYSFTATDAAGNQWWVNCETGFLDQFRRVK